MRTQFIFVQCRWMQTIHFNTQTFKYCKIHSFITAVLSKNSWDHVPQYTKNPYFFQMCLMHHQLRRKLQFARHTAARLVTEGYPKRVDSLNTLLWKLHNLHLYSYLWKQLNTESRMVEADMLLDSDAYDKGCFIAYSGWFCDHYMNL
jgi:hypothetical protein